MEFSVCKCALSWEGDFDPLRISVLERNSENETLEKKQCKFVQVFKTYFERQTVFQLLVDSLDVCNSQIGTGQRRKPEIVWVSHLVGSNPGAGAITSCLPGNTLAGSWNWKKSWNCKADPPEEKQVSQAVFDPLQ